MNRREFLGLGASAAAGIAVGKGIDVGPMSVGCRILWTNPYITDGLVAMWDGEWNAGGGVHDANATVWNDLSGNGHDLKVVDGVFEDTCGAVYSSADTEKAGWTTDMPILTEQDVRQAHTIDFVFSGKCDSSWNFNVFPVYLRNFLVRLNQNTITSFGQRFYRLDTERFFHSLYYIKKDRIFESTSMRISSPFLVDSRLPLSSSEQFVGNLFIGGDSVAAATNSGADMIGTNIFGRLLPVAGNFVKIHRVCVYDRILTPEENVANYAIDKERFGL